MILLNVNGKENTVEMQLRYNKPRFIIALEVANKNII
jgi:hypothetical protein